MPLETPARIAVLGAGPIGLETALYARYLGYHVDLFERGSAVADNLRCWEHVTLFSPFRLNCTPLGVAAIRAHDPEWSPPVLDSLITGREYRDRYLRPLAETDLLADSICYNTEVIRIGRPEHLKGEAILDQARGNQGFSLLLRTAAGTESIRQADAVIDCTGTYRNHNWAGQGGMPAVGEMAAQSHIEYRPADVAGSDRARYEGRHTLVVGSGYSAATSIVQLASLADAADGKPTEVTWVTRRSVEGHPDGPIGRVPNDSLASRDALAVQANHLAQSQVHHRPGTSIVEVTYREATDDFAVTLAGDHAGSLVVDRVLANVGFRPDTSIYEELQVQECYATGGPIKLAAHLATQARKDGSAADCLAFTTGGPESLTNPEPNFYILGSKSYGRNSHFLLSTGHEQIRNVFRTLAGRDDLDIYATMTPLENDE